MVGIHTYAFLRVDYESEVRVEGFRDSARYVLSVREG